MQLERLRLLNGGYCWQLERMAGVKSWKARKFQAVFIDFAHPTHGRCLIDTGYGPANMVQAWRWPWCLLAMLLPVPGKQAFVKPDYLQKQSIIADEVNLVFVSHFHPDHIGGTRLFPNAKFIYRQQAFELLKPLSALAQLKHGFIPQLLPDDFLQRGLAQNESQFQPQSVLGTCLASHDYFGDGSLLLIDLPGHALGHTGYLLSSAHDQKLLYVVDAFWDRRAIESGARLPWISRNAAHDVQAYHQTQQTLKNLRLSSELTTLACHCPHTQQHVTPTAH